MAGNLSLYTGTYFRTPLYNKLKHYLDVKNIPMKNTTSCAADGAPVIEARKMGA